MTARDPDEALDLFDASALAALEVLVNMPAVPGWATASTLGLVEVIASTRRRVFELRQFRREQAAGDARQKAAARQHRR
jgi:hypothetical protein